MIQLLVLLASAISLCISFPVEEPASSSFSCDEQKNLNCLHGFMKSLGIPSNVSSSDEFFNYITDYYKQHGRDGLVRICSAGKILRECEENQFYDCTSVQGWEGLGIAAKDAYAYATYTGQMLYECGPGYDAWYRNFDCIGKTYFTDHFNKTLAQCTKTLNAEIKDDPTKVCAYFQEFDECLSQPFLEACGKPAAHTYCATMASGFRYMDSNCNKLHCDYFV